MTSGIGLERSGKWNCPLALKPTWFQWVEHKSFTTHEIAARLHHRAVQIHPFKNGNGRWSRMLSNIYLKQKGLQPTAWNENLLAKENPHRDDYIQALKAADQGDYAPLIKLQSKTIQ